MGWILVCFLLGLHLGDFVAGVAIKVVAGVEATEEDVFWLGLPLGDLVGVNVDAGVDAAEVPLFFGGLPPPLEDLEGVDETETFDFLDLSLLGDWVVAEVGVVVFFESLRFCLGGFDETRFDFCFFGLGSLSSLSSLSTTDVDSEYSSSSSSFDEVFSAQ